MLFWSESRISEKTLMPFLIDFFIPVADIFWHSGCKCLPRRPLMRDELSFRVRGGGAGFRPGGTAPAPGVRYANAYILVMQ